MKSGDFVDREIIFLQGCVQSQEKEYDLTTDAIPICGKKILFAPFQLFDGKVRVWLPADFTEMPEKIAKVKYITKYRPPVILTNAGYDENFCFHLLPAEDFHEAVSPDSLVLQMQETIMLHAPGTVMYDKGNFVSDGWDGRWFEYKNFTLDDETYQMQFIISSKTYLLTGTFSCRMMFYDEWKKTILKVLEHIEIEEGRNAL